MTRCWWIPLVSTALACSDVPSATTSDTEASETGTASSGDGDGDPATGDGDGDPETGDGDGDGDPEPAPETVSVAHQFDPITLEPFEERLPCISWTIDNDEALYVQAVTLANTGGFHHSNGFVVPEDLYEGPDGVWDCSERGFSTIEAATKGTVLYAQSTQSWVEEQRFNPGAVIKIPPRYKVVSELHLLNLAPEPLDAALRVTLDLIHPKDVDVLLSPFAYQYTDLEIGPNGESRFVAECDDFMNVATPGDAGYAIHWLLPHYHYLGNYFSVEVIGGAHDGEIVHQITGFDGTPTGKRFDPPLEIGDADGFRLTCGYDNWTDATVNWGNGDGEMCIAFGFADTPNVTQATAGNGAAVGEIDGIPHFQSGCVNLTAPKPEGHGWPSQAELDGELYLPPVDPDDQGLPPVPPCEDTPGDAVASLEPTLTNVVANVFVPACSFSSCHGTGGTAGGLNLDTDVHASLLGHEVLANTPMPLVAPGDPEGSWLYHKLARCEPLDADQNPVSHMPLNAPFLLDESLVALVRDWIAAGAPDN